MLYRSGERDVRICSTGSGERGVRICSTEVVREMCAYALQKW